MKIYVLDDLCNGCKLCLKKCKFNAIEIIDHKAKINSNCTYCGICVENCPKKAIILEILEEKIGETQGDIWIYLEKSPSGEIIEPSLELLTRARGIKKENSNITGIYLGSELNKFEINKVMGAGAEGLIRVQDTQLLNYNVALYSKVLNWLTIEKKPATFIFPATEIGRDLAPRLATMLGTGLTADCTELSLDLQTGLLIQTRPAFGGDLMASIICPNHRPQMATVRPHSYKVSNFSTTDFHDELLVLPEQLKEENYSNFKLIDRKPIETVFPKIENEKILVSVGRGVGSKENVEVVYDFAKTIGAGIACSRPVVDNGWLPHELQVGLSGKVVAPKIYIALGISGSIQHIVGMQSSEYIIAVNKDEFAPIFKIAHLGIVGDIKKVLPRLAKLVSMP